MGEVARGCAVGVLASCVVHVGIVIALPREERAAERTAPQPLWLELQVEPPRAARPPSEPLTANVQAEAREVPRAVAPRRERPVRAAQTPSQPSELAAPEDAPAPVQTAPSAAIDLSPRAAARTLAQPSWVVLDASVAREDRPLSPSAQANALAREVPGLRASQGRNLEGVIVDLVEDALYDVLRPWKLLSRTTTHRGAYRYTGGGFDAEILPDGRVRFYDKDGPKIATRATQTQEFGAGLDLPPGVTGELSLGDPRALWQRLRGKDPHGAERRLFLERTRALREYLAGRTPERVEPHEEAEPREPQPEPR